MEDKYSFVEAVNQALIENGDGRYDYLEDGPYEYENDGNWNEKITQNGRFIANVSGDSLPAIMQEIAKDLCL